MREAMAVHGEVPHANPGISDAGLLTFFSIQVIGLVLLQKVSFPQSPVPITTALLLPFLIALFVRGWAKIDPLALQIYVLLAVLAIASQLLATRPFSAASLTLLLLLYLPAIFRIDVSVSGYRRCIAIYLDVMLAMAAIVLAESVWQFLVMSGNLPSLETILPEAIRVPGYVYQQPLYYGSPYAKPNAIFFLEVSFLSQFLAVALVAELVFFQRPLRLMLYLAAIFLSFGGTGLLALVLVAPLIAIRLPRRLLLVSLAILAVGAPIVIGLGWLGYGAMRFDEFGQQRGSGYLRFIAPLMQIASFAQSPEAFYAGIGAGNLPKGANIVWWASTKMFVEFGFLATAALYALLCYGLFVRAPSVRLGAVLFVIYNFMGGYLQMPVMINLLLVMGVLLKLKAKSPEDRRAAPREDRDGGPRATMNAAPPP